MLVDGSPARIGCRLVRWLVAHGRGRRDPRLGGSRDPGDGLAATASRCDHARAEVARYLLEHGAQVDVFCAAFLGLTSTLLRGAHRRGARRTRSRRTRTSIPITPLHYAVDGGSVAATRLLLASGADARTSGGRLLTSAASQGSIELVGCSCSTGAPRPPDAESLGPSRTDRTIARLLVARGLDLNVPIRDQETPLTMACRADKGEHSATVAALLELGADPNAKNAKRTDGTLVIAGSVRFFRRSRSCSPRSALKRIPPIHATYDVTPARSQA